MVYVDDVPFCSDPETCRALAEAWAELICDRIANSDGRPDELERTQHPTLEYARQRP
jgi:hypothetical protein